MDKKLKEKILLFYDKNNKYNPTISTKIEIIGNFYFISVDILFLGKLLTSVTKAIENLSSNMTDKKMNTFIEEVTIEAFERLHI